MKILPFLTIFGTIIGLPLQFINPSLQEAANIFFKLSAATYFGFVTLFTAIPHLDLLFLKIGIQEEFVSKIANIMIDLVFILQDAFLRIIFLLHGRKLYTTFQRLCHNSAKNLTSSAFKYYYWIVFVIWVFRVVLIVKGNWSRHTTKTFHDLNMTLEFETIQIGSMLFTNNFTVLVLFHFLADIFRLSLVTTAFLFYIATNEIHFNCVNELCYKITQDLEKESRLKLTFVFKSQAPTSVLQNYYPTVKKIDNLIFNEVVRGQICVLIPVYFLSCINLFYKGFTGFLDVFHAYWFEAILDGIGDVVAIFVIVYCGHDLSTQLKNWHREILDLILLSASNGQAIVPKTSAAGPLKADWLTQLELNSMIPWDWELSASGYFIVDLPLLTSIVGAAISYMVILIQFYFSNK